MGERGHLAGLSRGGRRYDHAHPADDDAAGGNAVSFQAHFTEPGVYKGWGQFRWGDRVIPFVVRVV